MFLTPKYQKMLQKLDELELMFILAVTILLALKADGRLPKAVEVLERLAGEE
jgi:hypothetical protein